MREGKEKAYRNYIADNLRVIGENTAKLGGGGYFKVRWSEIENPKPVETRSSSEIVDHMKNKLAGIGRADR